ncbi:translational GTPase TypA [Bacillota bacterium LX-D]|nr:translational GTPase TypA [Bacillota bacterium LX-D]
MFREDIRNVAIIAHVDHGKTTLVDAMLKQSGVFRSNEVVEERVMDSNDLERERGITILAKNTAVFYKDTKINIVDTPGHADFGGEVERVLKMVEGVLLVVDSFEGPMPQTKFVLRKALSLGLKPIVVINKIDRPDARCSEVIDEIFELFIELGADDEQIDFPVIYASARQGIASAEENSEAQDIIALFEAILKHIPCPEGHPEGHLQLLVNSLDYDSYIGRIAIGKIHRGVITSGQQVVVIKADGSTQRSKISRLMVFEGLKRQEVSEAKMGEIVAVAGLEAVSIGETIASPENPEALEGVTIDEPTLAMHFMVNNSPFAGQEGEYVTSRKLRERLFKELNTNVSLKVEETGSPDAFKVSGRGELHLSILIENMRREGYELQVSKPEVILKKIDGVIMEPVEFLVVDVPQDFVGPVMENLGSRKAEMVNMTTLNAEQIRLEYTIPARGLLGFRSEMLTDTKGQGIMSHNFNGYQPYKGEIKNRFRGSLIASEAGETTAYGLNSVEDRGTLFLVPGVKVYTGMVVGEGNRDVDIEVNVCKKKHLTNIRSSNSDEAIRLKEPKLLSLEEAIEFISDDELVEVTPKSIRLRKKLLERDQRVKALKQKNSNLY